MPDLLQRRRSTAAQMASLILANALIFQAELAEVNSQVRTLAQMLAAPSVRDALRDHWRFIQAHINYVPIFGIATDVLQALPNRVETDDALAVLVRAAEAVARNRAALRHDLMGRIYHRLLLDAKYLGTYYTSVPAATLLLQLALPFDAWPDLRWNDLEAISQLRIADLSCGTGTLLMAAQQTIADHFVRARSRVGDRTTEEDLRQLHQRLLEDVIYGYDVLLSAIHLTASTLGLLAPDSQFRRLNLFQVPLTGTGTVRLGSLDYAERHRIEYQLSFLEEDASAMRATGQGPAASEAPLPTLDLCVMNPPFVRSVGGNLLFGSLPPVERRRMRAALRRVVRRMPANTTAGLGSVFVAVADRHLSEYGRVGLVLPHALTTGIAWENTRSLFKSRYVVEYVISSHEPDHWNFSENTMLSEVLVVARRASASRRTAETSDDCTTFVNLWRVPRSPVEALTLAAFVLRTKPVGLETSLGVTRIAPTGQTVGEMVAVPWQTIRHAAWYPALFAQTDVVRALHFLRQGAVYLPTVGLCGSVSLAPLGTLGTLGPDRRDIHDGFELTRTPTSYAAVWGHRQNQFHTLRVTPTAYLSPRPRAAPRRPTRDPRLLWSRSGDVLLAERAWLETNRTLAVLVDRPVLSNVWWPFRPNADDIRQKQALVLWLNSTLGVLTLLGHRVNTRGQWIAFKKPMLAALPVLDVTRLRTDQLDRMAGLFRRVGDQRLQRFPEMANDPVRIAIDDALQDILGINGPLSLLREAIAREPVLSGEPLGSPSEEPQQLTFAFMDDL